MAVNGADPPAVCGDSSWPLVSIHIRCRPRAECEVMHDRNDVLPGGIGFGRNQPSVTVCRHIRIYGTSRVGHAIGCDDGIW
jgi:hypothetical protein